MYFWVALSSEWQAALRAAPPASQSQLVSGGVTGSRKLGEKQKNIKVKNVTCYQSSQQDVYARVIFRPIRVDLVLSIKY